MKKSWIAAARYNFDSCPEKAAAICAANKLPAHWAMHQEILRRNNLVMQNQSDTANPNFISPATEWTNQLEKPVTNLTVLSLYLALGEISRRSTRVGRGNEEGKGNI